MSSEVGAVTPEDREAADTLDDALGFLTAIERPIIEQALARHRQQAEARATSGVGEVCPCDVCREAREPKEGEAIESAARAMCDLVNGTGDYDENIEQRRTGWMKQAEAGIAAYLAAVPASPTEAPGEGAETMTYAVQHNPNCPSPYLVRLPRGVIDFAPPHQTSDALGYGKTFAEAFAAARLASQEQSA